MKETRKGERREGRSGWVRREEVNYPIRRMKYIEK